MSGALQALSLLLEREPALLEGRSTAVMLRAVEHPALDTLEGRTAGSPGRLDLTCEQGWRPEHDRLAAAGRRVTLQPTGPVDACFLLGTRYRDENLANFARGLNLLRPGGLFLAAMPNELGARRFQDLLAEALPVEVVFSKHKCRVFGGFAPGDPARLAEWARLGEFRPGPEGVLETAPGIFSWDRVDPASRLLADALPGELLGVGADLGAGYGYLSWRALRGAPGIAAVHLYEAEHRALEAARRNLAGFPQASFHWEDVTTGLPREVFDWVVMNPPFHERGTRRVELGERFVERAAEALRPGGELHMVANRNLPYEKTLAACFSRWEAGPTREGFKVLRAWL